jgi:hypothetical protein
VLFEGELFFKADGCGFVADNVINKNLLFEAISSLIYEDDYSEELKLKIINAKINAQISSIF